MIEFPRKREYLNPRLRKKELSPSPHSQFAQWYQQALEAGEEELNAMQLATATLQGQPSIRTVLAKQFDERGVTFFTDYRSRKATELEENGKASVLFLWKTTMQQVTIEGTIAFLPLEESAAYFRTRSRESQLGALSSRQGASLINLEQLLHRYLTMEERYRGKPIPPPSFWGGFLLKAQRIEFWQGQVSRLHDRFSYTLNQELGWDIERISP